MGLRALLGRLAAGVEVPVFPVTGGGARTAIQDLRLRSELVLVDSPRHAAVLVVAGSFPSGEVDGLLHVHDQLARPRRTIRWGGEPVPGLDDAIVVSGDDDGVVTAAVDAFVELMAAPGRGEPPLLPDVDPVEWRGVGPYGQGGMGMTGGTPYGRPMAERGPARDGLELDQVPITIGPWLPSLPPGLRLQVVFQGDVIQEVEVGPAPLRPVEGDDPFRRALVEPVPIAELELARARHHLRWLAEVLRVGDLTRLSRRALTLARRIRPDAGAEVRRLEAAIRLSGLFVMALQGVGRISDFPVGSVARAAGIAVDARSEDPGYRSLGFRPVTTEGADAAARVRQRLRETVQALDLAAAADGTQAGGHGVMEDPRGRLEAGGAPPAATLLEALPSLLVGQEWGDAVTIVHSLDIDVEAALRGAPA